MGAGWCLVLRSALGLLGVSGCELHLLLLLLLLRRHPVVRRLMLCWVKGWPLRRSPRHASWVLGLARMHALHHLLLRMHAGVHMILRHRTSHHIVTRQLRLGSRRGRYCCPIS